MNITPYTLSTFGRAHTAYKHMAAIAAQPNATAEQMRQQWQTLQPLLSKLFCEPPDDSTRAPCFTAEHYTGMADAHSLDLQEHMRTAWQRMRVLQGLSMHLQMWIFLGSHWIATHQTTFSAEYYSHQSRTLINAIASVIDECDAVPDDTEDWALDVIKQCAEEA